MKRGIMILIIFLVALFAGCSSNSQDVTAEANNQTAQNNSATYQDITMDQLKSMQSQDKKIMVIDVREQSEFAQGHLDGSILIPMSEIQQRVNEIPKDKKVVLVCASGARSSQVAQWLVGLGYTNIYNLAGGLQQ